MKTIISVASALLILLVSVPAIAQTDCNGPYFDSRVVAKETLTDEITTVLNLVLIDNDPDLDGIGACLSAQDIFQQAVDLIEAASAGNLFTITKSAVVGIINGIIDNAIRNACQALRREIQESYGLIANTVQETFITVTVDGVPVPVIGVEF